MKQTITITLDVRDNQPLYPCVESSGPFTPRIPVVRWFWDWRRWPLFRTESYATSTTFGPTRPATYYDSMHHFFSDIGYRVVSITGRGPAFTEGQKFGDALEDCGLCSTGSPVDSLAERRAVSAGVVAANIIRA